MSAPAEPDLLAQAGALGVAFGLPGRPAAAETVGGGHIHLTFVARHDTPAGPQRFVHQRLNGAVFGDLPALVENAERLLAHHRSPLHYLPTASGAAAHVDGSGAWWRCSPFLEGTRLPHAAAIEEVHAVAHAFGGNAAGLAGLTPPLRDTIPRFHDLARRRRALEAAVTADPCARAGRCPDTIAEARALAARVHDLLEDIGLDRLPVRVAHNDAKLDNVLVHHRSGLPVAITDLDTTMAGPLLNDAGELLRTASHTSAEDETDLDAITVDPARVEAILGGFAEGASALLTGDERATLSAGGPYLAVENAVRFLTDHLEGDGYFRVHRSDQNLDRARAQLRLTELLLAHT